MESMFLELFLVVIYGRVDSCTNKNVLHVKHQKRGRGASCPHVKYISTFYHPVAY